MSPPVEEHTRVSVKGSVRWCRTPLVFAFSSCLTLDLCSWRAECLPFVTAFAFCFQATSASLMKPMCSNSHWVIISAFSFLAYWTTVISTQKHALKQPLKTSATLPCLHYPISSSQQTSLRLWPLLVIFNSSCLPATIPLKLLLSESQ